MSDERTDIDPTVEEDGEAYFREMLERDPEFRRVYEERQPRRELGRLILRRRLGIGLSQRDLAERVGTSQNRIYLIEAGDANPTLDTLRRLAAVLDITLEIQPTKLVAR